MKAVPVSLRPAAEADYDFMRLLYHAGREEEMLAFPFTPEQKLQFLDWQFQCQWTHYREHYPRCEWQIVQSEGQDIGRILIDRRADHIHVVDIALMPAWRGAGVGSHLLGQVLEEGARSHQPVTVHVEVFNPAQRLYYRLGFRQVETSGPYHLLRWSPGQVNTAS